MNHLDALEKLHPDTINHFLKTGETEAIPPDLREFLMELQWAAEVYEYERNISRAAGKLRTRILATGGRDMDIRTCKARIYAAISYFNVDNNVAVRVWETDFADKYEDLARLAIASDLLKTARACYAAAHECRRRASEASVREHDRAPVFLISNDITLEQLGMQRRNLREIARKSSEGFYINLIEGLPVEKEEKERLLRDACITDAEIIEETFDE